MSEPPEYVRLSELLSHVNNARVSLGLKKYQSIHALSTMLYRKKVPYRIDFITGYKRYDVGSAIASLTRLKNRDLPWNRPGTIEELESREYMPLWQFCKAFRCTPERLHEGIHKLNVKAWRHPQTNRLWVHTEQAMQIALYRRAHFLYRMLSRQEADFIIATRPYRTVYVPKWNGTYRIYFAPECSHLGSRTTAYKEK